MQRALRWDGILAQTDRLEEIRAMADRVRSERPGDLSDGRFDIVAQGATQAADPAAARAAVQPYADAGATWWIDGNWEHPTVDSNRRRIQAGPPAPPRPRGEPEEP